MGRLGMTKLDVEARHVCRELDKGKGGKGTEGRGLASTETYAEKDGVLLILNSFNLTVAELITDI